MVIAVCYLEWEINKIVQQVGGIRVGFLGFS